MISVGSWASDALAYKGNEQLEKHAAKAFRGAAEKVTEERDILKKAQRTLPKSSGEYGFVRAAKNRLKQRFKAEGGESRLVRRYHICAHGRGMLYLAVLIGMYSRW